ncbi:MAG: TonB-dependent receptor [Phycisphaeraceae bacterium]|nr:TonB-dependent receptor [Phycisphaeraceae bacterium]
MTDRDFNDRPLEGVTVLVVQTEQAAVSDSQGVYLIADVPPGTYTLIFTREGFVRQVEADVLVNSGALTEVSASMPSEFTELPPLDVQELKLDAGSEIGLLEMRQDLPQFLDSVGEEQLSAAGVGDAAAALSLISGATVADNKPVVRGLPDRYVNSQVNSVRFPSADRETRSLELDQFPTDVIQSIQVSKTFTPDQQGDASGGAVNIVLKGIPDEDVIKFGVGTSYNTNLRQANNFRSYAGGGLDFFGVDRGRDAQPPINPNPVAVGTSSGNAPLEYSMNMTLAKRHEFVESGWTVGGIVNTFYDQGGSYYDDGLETDYLAQFVAAEPFSNPADRRLLFLPDASEQLTRPNGDPLEGNVFDITKSTEEVQWGGLFATGAENEFNKIDLIYLETNSIEDTTVVATDTNTRDIVQDALYDLDAEILASGNPLAAFDSQFNGLYDPGTDPVPDTGRSLAFSRNQTIARTERLIRSLQLRGEHTLPIFEDNEVQDDETFRLLSPEIDWTYAYSSSQRREPDKRVFSDYLDGSGLAVTDPTRTARAINIPTIGTSGVTSGYAQRVWEFIREDSNQLHLNYRQPFVLPNNEEGYFKTGVFRDRVERAFERETYVTSGVNPVGTVTSPVPVGVEYEDFYLNEVLTDSQRSNFTTDNASDVDYDGEYDIDAYYFMLDVPVTPIISLVGGVRVETTSINIGLIDDSIDEFARGVNSGNGFTTSALWTNFGAGTRTVNPDSGLPLGDVDFEQTDYLPSLSLVIDATEQLSFRGAYSETIARPTFRELTVVRDQEFLGSTPFFGNDTLAFSSLKNYDLRADYRPTPGGLISVSGFYKEIEDPIEVITISNDTIQPGSYLVPVNFSDGTILGAELEIRQEMGEIYEELTGLSLGANGTIIDSEVTIPAAQQTAAIGQTSREMLNAPDMLLNFFAVFRNEDTGTDIGLFYTIRGDTLVAGSSPTASATADFVPNVFETEYDTLNFTISQKLGEHFKIKFSAKNLTDPDIQRVYRSPITPETIQSSYNKGISFSVSLSAQFEF